MEEAAFSCDENQKEGSMQSSGEQRIQAGTAVCRDASRSPATILLPLHFPARLLQSGPQTDQAHTELLCAAANLT